MKEGFDREIDSLLRRRARGTAEARSWGDWTGDGSTGAHLDADELGAFAEGALPPPARVAVASHLVDCDSCRGIVVGLARVAGAGAEVKPAVAATGAAEPERTPAWRALIMSLFTPRVMRFAVPVLALSLVGVVSYVALRSKSGGVLEMARDARRQNTASQVEPSAPAGSTATNANANPAGLVDQNTNAAPRGAPAAGVQPSQTRGHGGAEAQPGEADKDEEDAQPTGAAPPPSRPASVAAEGPAELSKAAPKTASAEEGEAARTESRERSENRDKSARASEPADDAVSNDVAVQRRAQSRVNEAQMPDGGARNQKRADNNVSGNYGGGNAGAAAPPKESDSARTGGVRRERSARQAGKKAEAEDDETGRVGDTRTAAGHRFRREGNAWVDVNYKNSMPSTGVRRGTEAFRALVADVPDVGRVAEAIDGEVIVVVGRRAYRIR
jgi:hypothetical protein